MQPFPCTQADRTKIYPSGHPFRTKYGTGNGRIRPGPRPSPPGTGRANGSFHYPALPSHKRTQSLTPVAFGRSSRTRAEQKISPGQTHTGHRQPFPIHRTRSPNRQATETSISHNRPKTQESPSSKRKEGSGRMPVSGRQTVRSEEPRQKHRPAENRLPVRFPGSFRTLSARFDFFVFRTGCTATEIRMKKFGLMTKVRSKSEKKADRTEKVPTRRTFLPRT